MKKFISLMLAVITLLSLASCQLSQIVPPAVTTGSNETTNGSESTAAPGTTSAPEIEADPTYDYMANDLTQFVTLCEYKGIKITDKRIDVTDEMVDRYIGEMLIMKNEYTKRKTGVINEYDALNMDFVGKYKDTGVVYGTVEQDERGNFN